MSQSDYIKYKRVATMIQDMQEQPPVMAPQTLLEFKEFSLEKEIKNNIPLVNHLALPGQTVIFNMSKNITSCPTIPICNNTQTRTNRVSLPNVYFTPIPKPATIKATKNAKWMRTACNCILASKYTDANCCICKLGQWGIVR